MCCMKKSFNVKLNKASFSYITFNLKFFLVLFEKKTYKIHEFYIIVV